MGIINLSAPYPAIEKREETEGHKGCDLEYILTLPDDSAVFAAKAVKCW
jgi:hypothetical protein